MVLDGLATVVPFADVPSGCFRKMGDRLMTSRVVPTAGPSSKVLGQTMVDHQTVGRRDVHCVPTEVRQDQVRDQRTKVVHLAPEDRMICRLCRREPMVHGERRRLSIVHVHSCAEVRLALGHHDHRVRETGHVGRHRDRHQAVRLLRRVVRHFSGRTL